MKVRTTILLTALLFSLLPLKAWWDPGHMVSAQIAYNGLNPQAKAKSDELIKVLQAHYPAINNFVAASCWPDDLKADGVHFYDSWHYAHMYYNPDGVALPATPEVDIIWAINKCVDVLKAFKTQPLEKARALAFLIHFVGDIHQPLHSGSMYSHDKPGGDRGGNSYRLEGSHRNLHQFWDDGCGLLNDLNDIRPYGKAKEPISDKNMKRVQEMAGQIAGKFPANGIAFVADLDPHTWAYESHKLAKSMAYKGQNGEERGRPRFLRPGDEPSQLYVDNGRKVVSERLAAAGYRLADLLNAVWKE